MPDRSMIHRPYLLAALILPILLLKALVVSAETPGETPVQPGFSHQNWQSVLDQFVREDGMVDYEGLAADRVDLDRYLQTVEHQSPESHPNLFPTRDHALAYYLNAYNAHVFAGVLDRGPEKKSVWSGLISGYNFFVKMKVRVGGKKMSLKTLEDKHVRDAFQEPRIHAALNCASIGCPPLSRQAYLPETLEEQLEAATVRWVNDSYHCQVDHESRTVTLNKIFDWFRSDFITYEKKVGHPEPSLIGFINRFRPLDQAIPADYSVKFSTYDKAINSTP